MTPDTSHLSTATPAERRQAVWPWLLLPLVVLTVFFLLKTAKDSLPGPVDHSPTAADSAPIDDAGSN